MRADKAYLLIESKYSFKTPIGVHILYQHASNALKRAVALSPTSAMFLEYYVQFLVLVGDFQPACDYLESFYHMKPRDPHGPRMVRSKPEPCTMQEVVATATRDSVLMEVIIYRAAVSDRLFPGHQPMIEALRSAMHCSNVAFTREHLRLFRSSCAHELTERMLDTVSSFFPSHSALDTTPDNVRRPFSDMPFLHVTDEGRKYKAVPVYRGSSDTISVIDRASIVKREASREVTEFEMSRSDIKNKVNPHFLDELYEVLKSEVGLSSESDWRYRRKRKADDRSTLGTPTQIPAFFVGMVEDEFYQNAKASVHHIYSAIHEKLRRSNLLIPTSKAVAHSVNFFRTRVDNQSSCTVTVASCLGTTISLLAKGFFQVTKDAAKAALEEMKRVYPCADANFPPQDVVEETMRVKTVMFVRLRRLRLMELKKLLEHVLETIVFVDDKTFVDAVYTVCMQHGLFGVLNRVDILRVRCNVSYPDTSYKGLQKLPRRMIRLLTSPTFRKACNTSQAILNKLHKVHSARTAEQVKVLLWVERYKGLYGPILDGEEESAEESHGDNSSSESSADDSSSSDSSDDRDERRNKEHSDSGDLHDQQQ
ncbi:hypothetical protein PsorP6_003430 [Peronosclerospora sorghi]|uniref:Uncharacterized protein n=1 Tax=Peronosclerospora sorghi TaxID=230839 RepID=A0ACC0VQH5_9STRA|nr:hypothetical protein PsorP6_003430 [Peronosclerospora sorghi]